MQYIFTVEEKKNRKSNKMPSPKRRKLQLYHLKYLSRDEEVKSMWEVAAVASSIDFPKCRIEVFKPFHI